MQTKRLLLTVGLAIFAFAVVANGLDRLSRDAPALERVVPIPFRAQSDRAAATADLDRKRQQAALVHARAAVSSDPVDPDATPLLGAALLQVGRTDDAERAFRVAARFGWRNALTQAFWYDVAARGGDYELAADRADALLRVHPTLAQHYDLLQPLESTVAGRKALAERMQADSPWADGYLAVDDHTPPEVIDRRLEVMSEVASLHVRIGCKSVTPFTRALLQGGRRREAELLWNVNCPAEKVAGLIADPTFSHLLDDEDQMAPFSWRVLSTGDLSIQRVSPADGQHGWIVANSAPGIRLILVQSVAFPAGRYRFTVSHPADGPQGAGKAYLSWACNGDPPFPNTESGDLLSDGQEIQIEECDRQQIGLWLGGGGAPVRLRSIGFQRIG